LIRQIIDVQKSRIQVTKMLKMNNQQISTELTILLKFGLKFFSIARFFKSA